MSAPNIVLIMADQLAPQFLGTYGHPLVKTPHIDALAARGMRFDAAYCNTPLCAPSRASMMTGQMISRIETWDNGAEFGATWPSFAHDLRSAGYHTCLSGKMHFVGPDQLHGFERRLTTDIYPADHAWTPDWDQPEARIDKWYHNMDAVRQAGRVTTSFQYDYDEETTFLARRQIFDYAMQRSAPFALVVSLIHPHDPYLARPEWWDLYDGADIDLPETPPAQDRHSQRLRVGAAGDVTPVSDAQIRTARRAYFANVSFFDAQVGVIVKALEESDQLDNTVIIVTSDHGDHLGEHGLWYKMSFLEHSARVPLVCAGPGIVQGRCDAPVSLVDLRATFCDLAHAPTPDSDGASLVPLLHGAAAPKRTVHGEYCAECAVNPIGMIRRGAHKFIWSKGDPPLLFDVITDPLEQTNLAPDHPEFVAQFQTEADARWDSDALRARILSSQHRRRAVQHAMEQGTLVSWDYTPPRDAAQEFVRNHMDWIDVADRKRYPPPQKEQPE
ncbi:MAG: choline-sulfatase [Sedimentitalea sp.]